MEDDRDMNDKWLEFAIRIQSIAQAGLQYGKDKYDKERYEELREIAAEMMSEKTDIPVDKIRDLFCNETGYQTPKVDTRAAVFSDERSCLYMKIMEPGHCREDGVMWISLWLPIQKRKYGRKQVLRCMRTG